MIDKKKDKEKLLEEARAAERILGDTSKKEADMITWIVKNLVFDKGYSKIEALKTAFESIELKRSMDRLGCQ